MSGLGQRLHLRLFIEGIEVPVIAATVQINLNSPATAAIQVVPSDRILELKARTMVHLFFYDYSNDLPDLANGAQPQNQTDAPVPLSNYSLLFGGEVIGLAMSKTPLGRQAVLQCADWSTYWDTAYQMMITYGPNGNFLTEESAVWSGGNAMFNDIIDGHSSVMNTYLNKTPLTEGLQKVKGLMGGIISLLEAMGGVPRHTHGINDFFTIAELRVHLLQQITAEQNDNTAQRLFDEKEFMAWLERGITSLGELVTFRDMLKLLFNWIYYESVPVPAPLYVPGVSQTTSTKKVKVTQTYEFPYPKEIDDQLTDLAETANIRSQLTSSEIASSGSLGATQASAAHDMNGKLKTILQTPNLSPDTTKNIKKAQSFLDIISKPGALDSPQSLARNWTSVKNALNSARTSGKGTTKTTTKNKTTHNPPELDRLQTQIFRPDCFFAAPPRCNVLFPDQVTQFNYSRNFLQEVTRLRLQTGMAFIPSSEKLLASYHYAPALKEIRELAKKQGSSGIRALLPWEKFSGILPKFELVSEVNYIANKREKQLKKGVVGQAVNYAQRAANYNYLKYRFAARSLEITAKFNPFIVCGFPGLYIDKPFILDPQQVQEALKKATTGDVSGVDTGDIISNIRVLAASFNAPTQYLGMIASLTHQVGQEGGTTSVAMTHARSHRITEDDFLQIFAAQAVQETQTVETSTVLDAEELISKGDYKLLKFLIDATPQDAPDQAKQIAQQNQQAKNPQPLDPYDLAPRPQQNFRPASLDDLAPLLQVSTIDLNSTVDVSSTTSTVDGENVALRALTSETVRKSTGTKILVPAKGGKLKPDGKSKGPKGGVVTQIQVFSDQVVAVTIKDLEINEQGKTGRTAGVKQATSSSNKRAKTVYLWRKAAIYENVSSKKVLRPIPVEEALRPPWFSPLYSNMFIGDNIYQPFFGTGSVVDEQVFQTPFGTGATGANREQQRQIVGQLKAADGDIQQIQKILSEASPDKISDIPAIEEAADVLAYLYGEIRRQGLDVHRFITNYTYRPIATLEDVLGSADLEYQVDGSKLTKVAGVPGFHSTSVGPYKELIGLLDNPDQEMPRLRIKGKKFTISKTLDPRPERRAAAQAYADDLLGGSGSLGIGLLG